MQATIDKLLKDIRYSSAIMFSFSEHDKFMACAETTSRCYLSCDDGTENYDGIIIAWDGNEFWIYFEDITYISEPIRDCYEIIVGYKKYIITPLFRKSDLAELQD